MNILKMAAIASLSLLSTSAFASAYQGTVTSVLTSRFNNMAHVVVSNGAFHAGITGSCPFTGNRMVYSIDLTTTAGKALFDTALSAKNTGRLVFAAGDGVCANRAPMLSPATEAMDFLDLKG